MPADTPWHSIRYPAPGDPWDVGQGLADLAATWDQVPRLTAGLQVPPVRYVLGNDAHFGVGQGLPLSAPVEGWWGDVPASNPAFIPHDLGTTDIQVRVFDVASGVTVGAQVRRVDVDTVAVSFLVTPTAGQYRVVIVAVPLLYSPAMVG